MEDEPEPEPEEGEEVKKVQPKKGKKKWLLALWRLINITINLIISVMRSNSREDDLLKKLKNCVGDLAESTAYPRHSPSITRPNFIQPKENSIFPSKK